MRSLPPLLLLLATLVPGFAHAAPTACSGRYVVDGAPIDLGGTVTNIPAVGSGRVFAVGGDPNGILTMSIGRTCDAESVVTVPRDDAFVLRGRFVGCGDLPVLRMRLAFSADCAQVSGRIRSRGRLVRAFSGTLATGPNPPPVGPPASLDPGDTTTAPIGDAPAISVFAPGAVHTGDILTIFGRNLDRDRSGQPWSGTTPPYVVRFARRGSTTLRVLATPSFDSAGQIHVRVPTLAGTGTIVLAELRPDGSIGAVIAETTETLLVVDRDITPPPAPVQGTAPATQNAATVTIQSSALNALQPGTFSLRGTSNQAGAFLDANRNAFVDLADPTGALRNVPFLAFPVRTSEFDFSIEPGTGYFAGADAMLWFVLGDVAPGAAGGEVFVTVHLDVDIAAGTARPIAMVAGIAQQPGIVVSTDLSGFSAFDIRVESPVVGGPGAIRGSLSAVPMFLEQIFIPSQVAPCFDPSGFCPDFGPEIEQRLWANGVVVDFDLPLFNDAN